MNWRRLLWRSGRNSKPGTLIRAGITPPGSPSWPPPAKTYSAGRGCPQPKKILKCVEIGRLYSVNSLGLEAQTQFMEKIVRDHLSKVEVLPLSPVLLPRLLPKLSDVDTNFDEVVELIALDPSLTAKLLQICNSAYFGHESEVTSVSEAVSRVGYQAVYLLVAMISGSACFPCPTPKGIDATKLWRHSLMVAFNAKFVAESAEADGNLLFTAGLLHDLGKVILAQERLPTAVELYEKPSEAASLAREREFFGCTHAEVGAALLADWKLPQPTVAAVQYSHDPEKAEGFERMAACVALGNILAYGFENPQALKREDFPRLLDFLKLSKDLVGRWNERYRDHQALVTGMSHLPI